MSALQGLVSLAGRLLLTAIFLSSALMNKIPNFNDVVAYMQGEGVPMPRVMLAGAIVFLVVGSASLITGYRARCGAVLLLVFLALATYFFHDFWTVADAAAKQQQQIHFMKNLGLMGAMLFIIANGGGAWSMDQCCSSCKTTDTEPRNE